MRGAKSELVVSLWTLSAHTRQMIGDWDLFFFPVSLEFLSLVNTDLPIAVCDLLLSSCCTA